MQPAEQRLGVGKRRRERFLAEHVDPARRGGLDPGGVVLPGCCDVEGGNPGLLEHRRAVREDRIDPELGGAASGALGVRIVDGDDPRGRRDVPPRDQVIPADHAGPGESHIEDLWAWLRFGHDTFLRSRSGGLSARR